MSLNATVDGMESDEGVSRAAGQTFGHIEAKNAEQNEKVLKA